MKIPEETTSDLAFFAEVVTTDSAGDVQAYGVDDEELTEETLQLFQPFGFASRPTSGVDLAICPMADGSLAVVGCQTDDRPTLTTDGQVMVTDYDGQYLNLVPGTGTSVAGSDMTITLTSAGVKINTKNGHYLDVQNAGTIILKDAGTKLGTTTAAEAMMKGTSFTTALASFLTGFGTYLTNLSAWFNSWNSAINTCITNGPPADGVVAVYMNTMLTLTGAGPTGIQTLINVMNGVVTTFASAMASYISTKHYLDA